MDKREWEMLFKANAELNSSEMRAIQEEAKRLQELYDRESQRTEPIEAMLHIPYTESSEFIGQLQDIAQTESEIVEQIQELRSNLDSEKQARMESEKINTRFQWANLILVALTLIATIVFGLHSCTGTPTSGVQESEFAVTDSVPVE